MPFKNKIEIKKFSDLQDFRAYYYRVYIGMKEMKGWDAGTMVKKLVNCVGKFEQVKGHSKWKVIINQ